MFLHRWIGPQGRFTRLITADPDGTDIYMLNGDKMTSHCCWLNDKNILSFCESNGLRGYHHFEDKTSNVKVFSNKMPKVDGHPSISPNGKWIITDTYPDKARMACLYLYHIERDRIENMGRFLQPLKYKKEIRIDLHPQWSADGRSIYFESGHNGKRQLYSIFSNVY